MPKHAAAQKRRIYSLTVDGLEDMPHRQSFKGDADTYQGRAVDIAARCCATAGAGCRWSSPTGTPGTRTCPGAASEHSPPH